MIQKGFITFSLLFVCTFPVLADDAIDVQLLSSRGEHYKAMLAYDKLPQRKRTTDATIASARSAWALSLPGIAIERFDQALESNAIPAVDRARILFSRGIIEFQEDRFQVAALYAERAAKLVEEGGPFRAKIWLLSGEAAYRLGNAGQAAEFLQRALEESSIDDEGEVRFHLGEALLRLNRQDEAAEQFKAIPVTYEKIPQALRRLAEIALAKKEPGKVVAWLEKGMKEYPDQFLDSWVSYALIQAAIEQSDGVRIKEIQEAANKRYAPSDFWLSLINASVELNAWAPSRQGGTHES